MKNGLIINEYGIKQWFLNDKLHRIDGPAIEYVFGTNEWYKYWYKHGKLHREDGPAVERIDGTKYWYYNDKLINVNSQEEFEQYIKYMAFR